jgi:hypothetical protein
MTGIAGTEILTTVLVIIQNFMGVTPCSVVNLPMFWRNMQHSSSGSNSPRQLLLLVELPDHKDGSSMFLQKVSNHLSTDMMSYPTM